MAGRDMMVMSIREIRRLKAVQSAIDGHVTQKMTATMLGLSERQVRRLVRDVREQGDRGVIGSGDRGENVLVIWFRWTDLIMTGLKGVVPGLC